METGSQGCQLRCLGFVVVVVVVVVLFFRLVLPFGQMLSTVVECLRGTVFLLCARLPCVPGVLSGTSSRELS